MAYLGVFLIFCLGGATLSESATGFTSIGGSCANDECTIPNASCQDGICECRPAYVPRSDRSGCLPVVTNYQGTCEESIQCNIPTIPGGRVSCVNNQCVCHQQFKFRDGSCFGSALLGEPCKEHEDCTDIKVLWCFNQRCACRKGYREDTNRCVIGGNCENDQDCIGVGNTGLEHSFCDKRTRELPHCACSQGYVPAVNNTECLQETSRIGGSCVDDAQCKSLGAAECKYSQCMCLPGAKVENEKCNGASALASISGLLLLLFIPTKFII